MVTTSNNDAVVRLNHYLWALGCVLMNNAIGAEDIAAFGRGFWEVANRHGSGHGEIVDEFTDMPIGRERKRQLRQWAKGECRSCHEPRIDTTYCLEHRKELRERHRRQHSWKRRYLGAKSYKVEKERRR